MFRTFPVSIARRRTAALVAALGIGFAMVVAGPAAPARAAGVHPAAAAPAARKVMSVTAHHVAGGAITPFDNPLDITCTLFVNTPTVGGRGFLDSFVIAGSSV